MVEVCIYTYINTHTIQYLLLSKIKHGSFYIRVGKVAAQDIFVVLPRIAMLLAPGGYAALLLMSNRVRKYRDI
jgi:hypothetical protein